MIMNKKSIKILTIYILTSAKNYNIDILSCDIIKGSCQIGRLNYNLEKTVK